MYLFTDIRYIVYFVKQQHFLTALNKPCNIKIIFLVAVKQLAVILVFCYVKFLRHKRVQATNLQNTLRVVHNTQFVLRHQLFAEFLIIYSVAFLRTSTSGSIEHINRFLAERFGYILERGFLFSAKKQE